MWLPHSTAWTKYGSVGERGQNPVRDGRKGISGAGNTVAWVTAFTVKEGGVGWGENISLLPRQNKGHSKFGIFFFVWGRVGVKILKSSCLLSVNSNVYYFVILLPPVLS